MKHMKFVLYMKLVLLSLDFITFTVLVDISDFQIPIDQINLLIENFKFHSPNFLIDCGDFDTLGKIFF